MRLDCFSVVGGECGLLPLLADRIGNSESYCCDFACDFVVCCRLL